MSQAVCTAKTKRGAACRSFSLPDRDVCIMHSPEHAAQIDAARKRGGTVAMKLRVLQGKRVRLDSPKSLIKFVGDVMQDTLAGTVDPLVARSVLYGASIQRALIEASDLEQRLAALEESLAPKAGRWPA